MVECYSGLYEEGEVKYISCPHPPTRKGIMGGANQRLINNTLLISHSHVASGQVGGTSSICFKVIKLALNLAVEL